LFFGWYGVSGVFLTNLMNRSLTGAGSNNFRIKKGIIIHYKVDRIEVASHTLKEIFWVVW